MTKAEQQLCQLAERTVAHILEEGRKQGHAPDDFMQDADYHLDRAIRHAVTYRLMRDANQLSDADGSIGHLERAITRLVMARNRTEASSDLNCHLRTPPLPFPHRAD